MALTDRQKKIVNPFTDRMNSPSRRGVGYDYANIQNRFVLDAIHEKYLYFFDFPEVGTLLQGFSRENPRITIEDMLAYFAIYPQNGKVINDQPTQIDQFEANQMLFLIASQLREEKVLDRYSSRTTELTFLEEYQDGNSNDPLLSQNIANLIAIPPAHSKQYKTKLRHALRLPDVQYSDDVGLNLLNLDPEVAVYVSADTNVDLYDWRSNGLPGEDNDRVYYNPADRHYYYVKRTSSTSESSYAFNSLRNIAKNDSVENAIRRWTSLSQDKKTRYTSSVETAIREILKLTSRSSQQNFETLANIFIPPSSYTNVNRRAKGAECFPLLTYKDVRPGSRWLYALKIESSLIAGLEIQPITERLGDLRPSFEEYEISSLQKSQRLIGAENQTSTSVSFRVTDMIRYLLPVRTLLRENGRKLFEEGLTPDVLNGIDLEREASRLESFFELLELFCNYNKISLEDDDYVEFFFTNNFSIDHISINGDFYYQGCGINNYLNLYQESTRVVNAFSLYTPTTFSILKNSYKIYNEAKNQPESAELNTVEFITKYIYPSQDINALRVQRQNSVAAGEKILSKRKNVFTKLSELSETSPQQFENLFQTRSKKYRISSTLAAIDCNTGQAKAAKYALKIWSAANSKTRWRSLIRETIILLRQEVIEDEYARRSLSIEGLLTQTGSESAAQAAEGALSLGELTVNTPGNLGQSLTPAGNRILTSIEREINGKIFCSLDILGDFIEDNFLDPLGAPPVTKALTRKTLSQAPTFEFKINKPISLKVKQSDIYRVAIETILVNFVKSIVAGVAKDLINALLGCGPNSGRNKNSNLRSSINAVDFGSATLDNSFFNIGLVEAAKRVSLFNVEIQSINGQIVKTRSLPSLEQLQAFLNDAAKMCTPIELQQLLDGDADFDLLEHILETVSGNQIITRSNINPEIYNNINFTTENIRNFFIVLGDNLDDIREDSVENSPLAAYCDSRDPALTIAADSDSPGATLDPGDIDEQYAEIVNDKIKKINFLCDSLRDFQNAQLQLERLLNSLPDMTWYNDFLQYIADISNGFAEFFSKLTSEMFEKDQKKTTRQLAEYNLYSSELGTELFYQIFFPMRELPINQTFLHDQSVGFLTPAGWNTQRIGFGFNLEQDGEGIDFRGNFGARKNAFTENEVYTFIWQDRRDQRGENPARAVGPPRLNVPQYRGYPQVPYESFDAAYYSIRNAPPSLLKRLSASPSRTTTSELQKIGYGDKVRKDAEKIFLASVSKRVYSYFISEEFLSPYSNWTGASFLVCGSPTGLTENINISYFNPQGSVETIAEYNPAGFVANEMSGGLYYAGINGDYNPVNYKMFAGVDIDNHLIALNDRSHLTVDGVIMPTNESRGIRNLYGNFSIGIPSPEYTRPDTPNSRSRSGSRDRDVISIQNYTKRIDDTINKTVIADIGKRRLPRYVTALNKNPLKRIKDDCITANDYARAEAAVQTIQSRLASFFLNILPLAPVYPNWGSVGTVKLITDYLHRKIVSDLRQKELLGSFYEMIDSVKLVYPRLGDDPELRANPIISELSTPEINLKNIIEAVYLGILSNIQSTSEYDEVRKSIFDPSSVSFSRYRNTLLKFYTILGDNNLSLRSYGISANNEAATKQKIRQFYNEEGLTDLGMSVGAYYFPIAFQIASYMIYYDNGIKYSNRFSQTNYRSLLEIAGSDDSLLTVLKGQAIFKFAQDFAGFPISVGTWNGEREITYYNKAQVSERISTLDQYLNNFSFASQENTNSYNLERLSQMGQNDQEGIDDLFVSYFSTGVDGIILKKNKIQYRLRPWLRGERDDTISELNTWFSNWSTQQRGIVLPDAFNYFRTLLSAEGLIRDQNRSEILREGDLIWKKILEEGYKNLEVTTLTGLDYYVTLGSYFKKVAEDQKETADRLIEEAGRPLRDPPQAVILKNTALFFTYLSIVYTDSADFAAKVFEEKSILEKLITTNE